MQRLASVFLPLGEPMQVDRSPAASAASRQEAHGRHGAALQFRQSLHRIQ